MPTGTIGTRSFTYTFQIQNGHVEEPIEYEVICKYGDDNYVSIDSQPVLQVALSRAMNKILENDESLKAIYIDKVNMETLENTEYIAITIS
jgi:hypothetical protein